MTRNIRDMDEGGRDYGSKHRGDSSHTKAREELKRTISQAMEEDE